jgi:hypothetical protein
MLLTKNKVNESLDLKDKEILAKRFAFYSSLQRPTVGQYVIFTLDGIKRRISYVWDDGVQTSDHGSYYLSPMGASFSGSLHLPISKSGLILMPEQELATFWFFHHDFPTANSAVNVQIPVRVWECSLPAPT